jgi:ABC-type Fe3+-hydroxamate transport system substrate-binding protein
VSVALLATGCGGATEPTVEERTAEEPTADGSSADDGSSRARTVRHDLGEAEVPPEPGRVVVLDSRTSTPRSRST